MSQCCPNCGAPATRNVLHCEYCRTEFGDSTPGINIYALCDFDPETERIEVTTLGDPVRRYVPGMQDETFRK